MFVSMSKRNGTDILHGIGDIIEKVSLPVELRSASWTECVSKLMDFEMKLSEHKVCSVDVWQEYARKWREKTPDLTVSQSIPVYAGSYTEGMPNAEDLDIMLVAKWVKTCDYAIKPVTDPYPDVLPYTYDATYPGYIRIMLSDIARRTYHYRDFMYRKEGRRYYLSSTGFIRTMKEWGTTGCTLTAEGPALKGEGSDETSYDIVHAIALVEWPTHALDYFKRLTRSFRDDLEIQKMPVYAVAIGYRASKDFDIEWRLSFTEAEKYITRQWSPMQRRCYYLLKHFRAIHLKHTDVICSYFLKTILFWMEDILPPVFWANNDSLLEAFVKALYILTHFLRDHCVPNYFIPENNMISHKDIGQCIELSEYISSLLNSRGMNVVISELLCETDIDFVFEVAKVEISHAPIRSCRAFCKGIMRYHELVDRPEMSIIVNEAELLSSLAIMMSIWYKEQCLAMEEVISSLNTLVTPKMLPSFKTILQRLTADFYHSGMTRTSKSKAQSLYQSSLSLTYPNGFDDQNISGTIHLAFFKFLEEDYEFSHHAISQIYSEMSLTHPDLYLLISLPVWQSKRFVSDQILYNLVRSGTPEFPLIVNTIVLGFYILVRCKILTRGNTARERDHILKVVKDFRKTGKKIEITSSTDGFNMLFSALRTQVLDTLKIPRSSIPPTIIKRNMSRNQRLKHDWS